MSDFADRAAAEIAEHVWGSRNGYERVEADEIAAIIRKHAVEKPEPRNVGPPAASPAGSYHDNDPCDGAV